MKSSIAAPVASRHPVIPDMTRPRMAKAHVQNLDIAASGEWMVAVGRAIERAVAGVGWSKKEAAARVQVDDAEFGKWLSGARRPQLDRLFAVPELRPALIVALAALEATVEIVTEIRLKKVGAA